ncbi:hypothetical protein Sya03_11410 [Spirilliplanes yamanashiensis]|uniref:DUF218 domain-containing protein n=1 Tax=Spirilliplanes yamanashiensis TaxID=42233 RepID=A0A8J3Y5D7_9ACTN|nr:hypothetical protein Sya03_11410 [Spirilliplanes yamanashiensis]
MLVVFGRGVQLAGGRWSLTAGSAERVHAAVDYVLGRRDEYRAGGRIPRVIFTGGWAEAAEGAVQPPDGSCEGDLMVRAALAAGLGAVAELRAETRSRSTLENLLHVAEEGLLTGYEFAPGRPLGLVTHPWHLPRVRFLAGKVLGLRGAALTDVPVPGGGRRRAEWAVYLAARLCFVGVRDAAALRRRERTVTRLTGMARRLRG